MAIILSSLFRVKVAVRIGYCRGESLYFILSLIQLLGELIHLGLGGAHLRIPVVMLLLSYSLLIRDFFFRLQQLLLKIIAQSLQLIRPLFFCGGIGAEAFHLFPI